MTTTVVADRVADLDGKVAKLLEAGLSDLAIASMLHRSDRSDLLLLICRLKRSGAIAVSPAVADQPLGAPGPDVAAPASPVEEPSVPQPPSQPSVRPIRTGGFQETAQHVAIFKAMTERSSAVIEAVAGSGKTTTLVEGCKRALRAGGGSLTFLAYNRSIVATLRARLPADIRVCTLHSLAFQAIRRSRSLPEGAVRDGRVMDAAWSVTGEAGLGYKDRPQASRDLRTLWSLALNTCTPMLDGAAIAAMAASIGLAADVRLYDLVGRVDRQLRADTTTISYDEMMREVVEKQYDIGRSDMVLVDEAQDLNRMQLELVAHLQPRSVIAVGDPHQAIYAFRGADALAIETLASRFGIANRLPLSVTYRCAKSIVKLAQRYVPSIEARADAPEGLVDCAKPDRLMQSLAAMGPGDLALCRNNRPLIGALLHRRRLGDVPVRMIGEDIANALIGIMDRVAKAEGTSNSETLAAVLSRDVAMRAQQLRDRGQPAAADAVEDEGMTAVRLLQETKVLPEAVALARTIFSSSYAADAVNFATIHKSKGLEADRVVFLGHNLIPSRRIVASRSAVLLQQEQNLLYVGVTRARTHLVLQELRDEGDLA